MNGDQEMYGVLMAQGTKPNPNPKFSYPSNVEQ
jgi:hypothetical protein